MAVLDAKTRAGLPDSAFAYIDSQGKRRLPIHDRAHVQNALARFNQVHFEDEAARDRSRLRLLRAAQKHGIAPIGFVTGQLSQVRRFPRGHVTFLLTDIQGSTELVARLDERYAELAAGVRRLIRIATRRAGGHEVDARGDEFFAVFPHAAAALDAAVAIQRATIAEAWLDGVEVRVRMGVHSGRPTLTESGYFGLSVHATARICYSAHGGQIVLSAAARGALADELPDGVSLSGLGTWRFQGLREALELFQVEAPGLPDGFPQPRTGFQVREPA